MNTHRAIEWVGEADGFLRLLDQTRLPEEVVFRDCRDVEQVREAICHLAVRGAPAIGVSAAYGLVLAAQGGVDFLHAVERQRGFGDFYGFVLVAQGSGELMIDHGVHAWDVAALIPIIEEAGGKCTDWDGGRDIHRPDVLASNGKLHAKGLAILNGNAAKGSPP